MYARALSFVILGFVAGCRARTTNEANRPAAAPHLPSQSCSAGETSAERDEIYQLLAYTIVSVRWQDGQSQEGHHIGAILVSADGDPLYWATNANFSAGSATEHAEARVIRNYLASRHRQGRTAYRLTGDTIYSTLEPCAMCIGTMAITGIARVVYGQTDLRFGKASERLRLDSRSQPGGLAPYPDVPESRATSLAFRARIESAQRASGMQTVTAWLDTPAAHALFQEAQQAFEGYQPRCSENESALRRARGLVATARRQSMPAADADKER